MKTMLILILSFLSLQLNAQQNLYSGIKSGCSPREFQKAIMLNPDFKSGYDSLSESQDYGDYITTVINERQFVVTPVYNSEDKLESLMFISANSYGSDDVKMRIQAFELCETYSLKSSVVLKVNPISDLYLQQLKNGSIKPVCVIKTSGVNTHIFVVKIAGRYRNMMVINDSRFNDILPSTDSKNICETQARNYLK